MINPNPFKWTKINTDLGYYKLDLKFLSTLSDMTIFTC